MGVILGTSESLVPPVSTDVSLARILSRLLLRSSSYLVSLLLDAPSLPSRSPTIITPGCRHGGNCACRPLPVEVPAVQRYVSVFHFPGLLLEHDGGLLLRYDPLWFSSWSLSASFYFIAGFGTVEAKDLEARPPPKQLVQHVQIHKIFGKDHYFSVRKIGSDLIMNPKNGRCSRRHESNVGHGLDPR